MHVQSHENGYMYAYTGEFDTGMYAYTNKYVCRHIQMNEYVQEKIDTTTHRAVSDVEHLKKTRR
jgi:hypothetical protein